MVPLAFVSRFMLSRILSLNVSSFLLRCTKVSHLCHSETREAKGLAQDCTASWWQSQPRLSLPGQHPSTTCPETRLQEGSFGGRSMSHAASQHR